MRLIHLYRSKRESSKPKKWDIHATPDVRVSKLGFPSHGFFWLWQQLLAEGIVDDVAILYNTAKECSSGTVRYADNLRLHVIPYIGDLEQFYRPGDVVLARGWGEQWIVHLVPIMKDKPLYWYSAGAPPKKNSIMRTWCDVLDGVLVDCPRAIRSAHFDDLPHIEFLKPINPDYFTMVDVAKKYDICIGASQLVKKKGQLGGVEAVVAYKKLYGKKLRCIVPGKYWDDGVKRSISRHTKDQDLPIEIPGDIPSGNMNMVYNASKMFLYLGDSGCNDRSVLEAMACGCPVMMRKESAAKHASFVAARESGTFLTENAQDAEALARDIHALLEQCEEVKRKRLSDYFWAINNRGAVLEPWRNFIAN